jgi:signal transduction histidine kinase
MDERVTGPRSQEQSHQALSQRDRGEARGFVMKLPWWRSPLAGYLMCPFVIGMASLVDLSIRWFGLTVYSINASFYLVTVLIAWLWGVGPALLGVVLGFLILDTAIIPPYGVLSFNGWSDLITYLPFILAQLLVVLITAQLEKAKRRSFVAERRAQIHAQELAEVNRALAQNNQHLEQLNSHLAEANQLKDYFLSQASHELKTPITTIRGNTQLILRRLARSQKVVTEQLSLPAYLERIDEQTHRLQALIEDLLDMSSLSSGKIPLRLTCCDVGDLCRNVIEDQHALSNRQIELELPSEPLTLQADSQRLMQVMINLVSNAVKYSPEDSVVRVCVSQDSSHLTMMVHNDGPAISPEQQSHIFEPFYRVPEVERSSIQGSGLGLAISKEIVEQHEGQIRVESSEEKGTAFFVELPLHSPHGVESGPLVASTLG